MVIERLLPLGDFSILVQVGKFDVTGSYVFHIGRNLRLIGPTGRFFIGSEKPQGFETPDGSDLLPDIVSREQLSVVTAKPGNNRLVVGHYKANRIVSIFAEKSEFVTPHYGGLPSFHRKIRRIYLGSGSTQSCRERYPRSKHIQCFSFVNIEADI